MPAQESPSSEMGMMFAPLDYLPELRVTGGQHVSHRRPSASLTLNGRWTVGKLVRGNNNFMVHYNLVKITVFESKDIYWRGPQGSLQNKFWNFSWSDYPTWPRLRNNLICFILLNSSSSYRKYNLFLEEFFLWIYDIKVIMYLSSLSLSL